MRPIVAASLVALLASGCELFRSTKPEPTRCPESQGLMCLTAVVCSADLDRGCLVCQCSPATAPPTRPVDSNLPVTR